MLAADPLRLLIVDPSVDVLTSLGQMLHRKGCHVTWAASGEAALRQVQYSDYDLVIADTALTDMSGLDLSRAIKALDERVLTIVLGDYASFGSCEGDPSVDLWLSKPLDPEVFLRRTRELLQGNGHELPVTNNSGSR